MMNVKRFVGVMIIMMLSLLILPIGGHKADAAAGDMAEDPIMITDEAGLAAMASGLDKHYRLGQDITLAGDWQPLGSEATPFTGSLDGDGYTIDGFSIIVPGENNVGFFRKIGTSGQVFDLTLEGTIDIDYSTGIDYVGGLAGLNDGRIANCTINVDIDGPRNDAGIVVGDNLVNGMIKNVTADGGLTIGASLGVGSCAGGIAGYNYGAISACQSSGDLLANWGCVGGIAGYNSDGAVIDDCESDSVVTAALLYAGGIAGFSNGITSGCVASGVIIADGGAGGLIGIQSGGWAVNSQSSGEVTILGNNSVYGASINCGTSAGGLIGLNWGGEVRYCSASGKVTGPTAVGGLIGWQKTGNVAFSSASGAAVGVPLPSNPANEIAYFGGLIGRSDSGSISCCYALGDVSGEAVCAGLVGDAGASVIDNSYARGDVTANRLYAGFIGNISSGSISDSYSAGWVDDKPAATDIGGFATGVYASVIDACYYDQTINPSIDEAYAAPGTTAQLQTAETFSDWNFDDIWVIDGEDRYPSLQDAPDTEGPAVDSLSPDHGSPYAELDDNLVVAFDESIQRGWGRMRIVGNAEEIILQPYDDEVGFDGHTLTVNLTDDLERGVTYTVTIPAGFVCDMHHNLFAGAEWTFTAGEAPDVTEPLVDDASCAVIGITDTSATLFWDKATDNKSAQSALTYQVYYSSAEMTDLAGVQAGTAVGTATADLSYKILSGLVPDSHYYFGVVVTDEAGNQSCMITAGDTAADAPWEAVGGVGISAGNANSTALAFFEGTAYLTYMDGGNGNKGTLLKYDGASGWQAVGGAGFTPGYADLLSIDFDTAGIPYVAFRDGSQSYKLTVMKYTAAGWQAVGSGGFSGDGVGDITICLVDDIPYVAYRDNSTLNRATAKKYDAGSNTWLTLGSTGGFSSYTAAGLAMTIVNGTPVVSFSHLAPSPNNCRLTVMAYESGSNTWQSVGSSGLQSTVVSGGTHIAFNPDGGDESLYVVYSDAIQAGRATVMCYDSGSGIWSPMGEPGFTPFDVYQTQIAIREMDTYVAFNQNTASRQATVMKWDGHYWISVGQSDFSNGNTDDISLAISPIDGLPYLAYRDDANGVKATVMRPGVGSDEDGDDSHSGGGGSSSQADPDELNGQTVNNLAEKQDVIKIETDLGAYMLPAELIDINRIAGELGDDVDLADIKVRIEIKEPSAAMIKLVADASKKGKFSLVVPPVEFTVTCSYAGKTLEINKFHAYVERTIAIPAGADHQKITTAVVIDADGRMRHVPTKIVIIDGKYYARIKSLTNSTYAVIWNPVTFLDVENHWAKEAVDDMASRMIITGVDVETFQPDRQITRAEFAAILVRALGLPRVEASSLNSPFIDVLSTDWFAADVQTAYAYQIISGYSNGQFRPQDNITREQAMTMIARAASIAGLKAELKTGEMEKLLVEYADGQLTADYARNSIALCLQLEIVSGKNTDMLAPKDKITRAEVATLIRRMLQKADLI